MIEEGTIFLGDDRRLATMPKPLREKLKADGWKDGGIIWHYDEDTKVLTVLQKTPVMQAAVEAAIRKTVQTQRMGGGPGTRRQKRDGETEIWIRTTPKEVMEAVGRREAVKIPARPTG